MYSGSFGDYTLYSFNIMKNVSSFFGGGVSTGAKKATIKTSNQTTFNMQSNLIGSMAKFNCTILSTPPTKGLHPQRVWSR